MTEALWLRINTIESFAADVAHEIKNPLASLRSAVESLRDWRRVLARAWGADPRPCWSWVACR